VALTTAHIIFIKIMELVSAMIGVLMVFKIMGMENA